MNVLKGRSHNLRPLTLLRKVRRLLATTLFSRKHLRFTLLACNVLVLVGVGAYVFDSTTSSSGIHALTATSQADAPSDPLDQVSSADIAMNLARMARVPETTAITNQADSVSAEIAVAPVSSVVVSKPQAVSTALKSRKDIKVYTTVDGDNISAIAAKFGVTSDSILWSNGLSGNSIAVGKNLTIPPVNGIVYTVKSGDTPDSLATKYKASKEQIIAFNDAEIGGLKVGTQIIIPGGQNPAPVYASAYSGFSFGSSAIYGYNGYDRGFCTYYVATRLAVPSNWGNANTWDNLAPMSGWKVSSIPRPGAVGQTDRGYFGHVAYVEAVNEDGTMIKYSDMNGLAGFNRVGYSDWVPANHFEHYIYQ